MLEIEQKFRVGNHGDLEQRLSALGARRGDEVTEADQYFNAPDRDFGRTGEAFRLRRIGEANFLTYKGPRAAHAIKTRRELEVPLPSGDAAAAEHAAILVDLGYRPVAVVRKRRRSYHLDRDGLSLTVCLDEVEELGRFAEVEVLAPEEQTQAAQSALTTLARELGLSDVEQRSYLTMLLTARAPAEGARPVVIREIAPLRDAIRQARARRKTIGLVPTMGALHEGHISLVREARKESGLVVVSVFVNPTQFGPSEDFERYPRPLERDVQLCADAGVDLVFAPVPATIYPPGFRTYVEITGLQEVLEGASRPGHFRGVATVVLKLFNLVGPDRAWFGQKDAQQVRIIQQMVRDLDVPVEVRVGATMRAVDGLALSSRNQYLDADQRRQATVLRRTLEEAAARIAAGERDGEAIRRLMSERIAATPGAVLDYAAVVDADTLTPVQRLDRPTLLALAVKFGGTRLIDNTLLPSLG
jgi:pantoate--beta-alanine ligase